MTTYAEFRLRLERADRAVPGVAYRVEASGLGGEAQGQLSLPFSPTELENFILKVGRTRRGVRRIELPEMELAKTFGGRLFSAVMVGRVGELYRAAFAEARAAGSGLRLTLSLTDAPELAAVPWEYLYDEPAFLSISTWTPVVRYLDLPKPRRALEVQLPLRILGIVGTPWDAETLNTAVEQGRLEDALRPLIDAGAVTLDWLEEVNLLALARKLRPDTYHVLHFIGHGGFDDASGEGAVLFEDSAGRGRLVSGDQLGTVLADKVSLRLVVLNSCEGARTSLDDPFSGVAASLVRREIPAVIGMQFEITDRAAVLFAGEFYAMLAAGRSVDSAVTEARLAIFADQNDVEWGTPVLFMRVADGQLFSIANAPPARHVDPEILPPKPVPAAIDPGVPVPPADATEAPTGAAQPVVPEDEVAATLDGPRAAAEAPLEAPPEAGEPGGPAAGQDAGPATNGGFVEVGPGSFGDVRTTIVHPVSPDASDTGPMEIRMLYVPGPIEPRPAAPDWVAPEWAGPGRSDELEGAPGSGPDAPRRAAGASGRSAGAPWLPYAAALIVVFFVALMGFVSLFQPRTTAPTTPPTTGALSVEQAGADTPGHIVLNGSDFEAGETVDLTLNGSPAGTAEVVSDGTFTALMSVVDQPSGEVAASGRSSGRQASSSYRITLPTDSPPASAAESPPSSTP